jgi:hypothetical protein
MFSFALLVVALVEIGIFKLGIIGKARRRRRCAQIQFGIIAANIALVTRCDRREVRVATGQRYG